MRRCGGEPRISGILQNMPSAWPLDTHDCAFLGRAVDQIGAEMFPHEWTGAERSALNAESLQRLDHVHALVANAIEAGELKLRARLTVATENRMGVVNPTARTPAGWIEALRTYQIEEIDCRPWISVRQRRRIPQAHWLFVTKESLDRFFKGRE